MSGCRSIEFGAALLTGLILALLPEPGHAQACCAGAAAGQLGRLALHEEALVGLDLRAERTLGSFDDDGAYRPYGSDVFLFQQSLLGTLRLGERAQVGTVLPLVQNYASTRRESGFGGGVGDVQFAARYDFSFAGQSLHTPGLAALGGVSLPTGRALEETTHPLGVDATGRGGARAWGGLAVEQSYGIAFVQVQGLLVHDLRRSAAGREYGGKWGMDASLLLGASLPSELTLALFARHETQLEASRRLWRFGASAGYPLRDWRLQAGLFVDPPVDGLGRNENLRLGLHFAVMRIWT
ncbi:MAG: hypothetical protein DIU72_011020 [Pseudomonadota bacterium]|nr:MAG: hypothetical protein DIU72_04310 [Pseudomonadota bacterium]